MMVERKILEALDACRPGSDDLTQPEHAELAEAAARAQEDAEVRRAAERLAQFDARMATALDDVPLPSSLADRMKQRLAEPTLELAEPAPVAVEQPERRSWLWNSLVAVAATVLVAAGIWSYLRPVSVPLTSADFRALSREGHSLAQSSGNWNTRLGEAPADLRFPQESLLVAPRAFQPLTLENNRQAVAYDISVPGIRASLLVYRGELPDLDLVPPRKPRLETQRVSIGLWQRDGLIFALVVEGSERDYRQLIQSTQGSLG